MKLLHQKFTGYWNFCWKLKLNLGPLLQQCVLTYCTYLLLPFRRGGAAGDQAFARRQPDDRDVRPEPALLLQGCVRPAARRVALRQRHQRRRRQPRPTKAVLRRARLVQTQRPKVVVVVVLIASWFWLHFVVVVVFAVFIVTAPVDAG